jgi:hypothetical protein
MNAVEWARVTSRKIREDLEGCDPSHRLYLPAAILALVLAVAPEEVCVFILAVTSQAKRDAQGDGT